MYMKFGKVPITLRVFFPKNVCTVMYIAMYRKSLVV